MTKAVKEKQIVKNISLSLFAQIVSLLVSFVLGIIVPKFIDEYQYAYWHTYLLFFFFFVILHFGLLDGLVLRFAQYDYEELDKRKIRSQFAVLLVVNSIAFCILILAGVVHGGFTKTIAVLVACGIFTKNIFTYNSYLFQITNRLKQYAFIVIAQRLAYGILVVLCLCFGLQNFIWYCLADLAGDCMGIVFGLAFNKDLHFGEVLPVKEIFQEARLSISAGLLLLTANLSSMLMIGAAKIVIEWKWGPLFFGKTSFAFGVSNLVLTFVTAVSIVLFPSLKRMDSELLPSFYKKIRDIIMPLLFWGLLLYFPECWILEKWLPKYSDGLIYLGVLSPIIVYLSVVSLLTNNYLKAYRQERLMCSINFLSVLFACCLYGISAYFLENFMLMLMSVVATILIRSIVSELMVTKLIHIKMQSEFVLEFVMTCVFMISVLCFNRVNGFLVYFTFLILYSYINLNSTKLLLERLKTLAVSHL